MGIRFDLVRGAQTQLRQCNQNQRLRIVRQLAERFGQARFAHQNGNATVGTDLLNPAQIQMVCGLRPRLLAKSRTELADLMGDFIAPGHLVLTVTGTVEPVRQVMPVRFCRRLFQRLQQRFNIVSRAQLGRSSQQVGVTDLAALPQTGIVIGRHQAANAAQCFQACSGIGKWLIAQFPQRVYRNELIQWPGGRNAFSGGIHRRQQCHGIDRDV